MGKGKRKCFRCGKIDYLKWFTPMTITPDETMIYCCSKCVQDWNNCEEKFKFFHDRSKNSFLWLKYFLIFVKRTKKEKIRVIYT